MDIILRDLSQLTKDFTSLCTAKSDLFNISASVSSQTLADKTSLVKSLSDLVAATIDLTSKCAAAHAQVKQSRDTELTTLDQLYAIAHGDAVWTARESKYGLRDIAIVPGVELRASCVRGFGDVKQDGSLYYIESANHFAFMIAGVLFHGNIGTVYTDEKQPIKIKNCAYGNTCVKKSHCDYYHDPATYPGSKDIRNYMSGGYTSGGYTSGGHNGGMGGRFGRIRARPSRTTLASDIAGTGPEDAARNRESVVHDVLCALCM